jgi:hypothetical protein
LGIRHKTVIKPRHLWPLTEDKTALKVQILLSFLNDSRQPFKVGLSESLIVKLIQVMLDLGEVTRGITSWVVFCIGNHLDTYRELSPGTL